MIRNVLGQSVFTTGQIARMYATAPRTVAVWFDSGMLKGYRIPGSMDRRIPRESLIAFLKEHGIPLGTLESDGWHKLLIIGAEPALVDRLRELLPEADDYRLEVARTGFEAGIQAESFHPDSIIIDLAMGRSEGLQIAGNLRRDERYAEALIVALAGEDEQFLAGIACRGFDESFQKPFDPAMLAERVKQHRYPVTSNGTDTIYKGGKGRKAK